MHRNHNLKINFSREIRGGIVVTWPWRGVWFLCKNCSAHLNLSIVANCFVQYIYKNIKIHPITSRSRDPNVTREDFSERYKGDFGTCNYALPASPNITRSRVQGSRFANHKSPFDFGKSLFLEPCEMSYCHAKTLFIKFSRLILPKRPTKMRY